MGMLITGELEMVSTKSLAISLFVIGMFTFFSNSFAQEYNYETSEKIIIKGEILHSSETQNGAGHYFTVLYKGNLYWCFKTWNQTECAD